MTHHLALTANLVILTAALLLGAPAEAAEMTFDRATHITLEDPVRVPGATLPAGDYVFTLSASEVVWIRSEDDSQVYGPYFTRPVRRPKSSARRKIVVRRSAASGIPTLRGWFGRHRTDGYELVW